MLTDRQARTDENTADRQWHLSFLGEASTVLASSLDYHTTLASVARLAVPRIADWCVVEVIGEDGQIQRLAAAHVDPAKERLAREVAERYPPNRRVGESAPRVLQTGRPELTQEITDEMLQRGAHNAEHLQILRELGLRSAMAVPLITRGRTLGAITFIAAESGRRFGPEDVKMAEELARRSAIAVDNSRLFHQAQEALRLREEFLSVASHELRTPLTALQLQMQMLQHAARRNQESLTAERVMAVAEASERQIKRLTKLTNDLLDAGRLASGWVRLDTEEVDLAKLVAEVVQRFDAELVAVGCALELRTDGPIVGEWDPFRLDQVVTNLVSNAIRYGRGEPIEVTVQERDGNAALSVRDHGIGIAPEDLPRIFERFERVVPAKNYGGLGLGLYIARQIVEAHGGMIRAASSPKGGSTFTVTLPFSPIPPS